MVKKDSRRIVGSTVKKHLHQRYLNNLYKKAFEMILRLLTALLRLPGRFLTILSIQCLGTTWITSHITSSLSALPLIFWALEAISTNVYTLYFKFLFCWNFPLFILYGLPEYQSLSKQILKTYEILIGCSYSQATLIGIS